MARSVGREAPTRNISGVSKSYQVFVSHATDDKWIAKRICEQLEQAGAATFRDDRDIQGGDDIPDEIRRQIKRSREMVVLLTPSSLNRQWVLLEIGAAWLSRKKMRIVAVLCHVGSDGIPEMLKSKKAIPLNDFDQYAIEVSQRVKHETSGKE